MTLTIKAYDGRECSLSSDCYVLKGVDNKMLSGSKYQDGTIVRLISGVDGSRKIGYHFSEGFVTVCRVGAAQGEFVGVGQDQITPIDPKSMMAQFNRLIALSAKMPTGTIDPKAIDKYCAEYQEMKVAHKHGDRLGAIMEGGDCLYYLAKMLHNGLATISLAMATAEMIAEHIDIDIDLLFRVAETKYNLRAQPGNKKDDAAEREAVAVLLDREGVQWRSDTEQMEQFWNQYPDEYSDYEDGEE